MGGLYHRLAVCLENERSGGRYQHALRLALIALILLTIGRSGAHGDAGPTPTPSLCGNGSLDEGEECDDGNLFGGDGCAANCTIETEVLFVLDTAANEPRSRAIVQTASFVLALDFSGSQISRIGKPGPDGIVPVALQTSEVLFNPIPVPGFACLCSRAVEFPDFGSGNAGVGQIGCGENGLAGTDVTVTVNHRLGVVGENGFTADACLAAGGTVEDGSLKYPHAGVCNGPPTSTRTGAGPTGSAVVTLYTSFDVIPDDGSCRIELDTKVCEGGANAGMVCTGNPAVCTGGSCIPAKGRDGIPCDEDDPVAVRGVPQLVVNTTGTAHATILNANNRPGTLIAEGTRCGVQPCATSAVGLPLDCDKLYALSGGGILVSAFPALHIGTPGDSVNTVILADASAPTYTPTATAPPTATPTASATPTHTPTETPPLPPLCIGDCDRSGKVAVDELVLGVNIALGEQSPGACSPIDCHGDGHVTVDCLVQAVNNALNGCTAR